MTPCEALYRRWCTTRFYWEERLDRMELVLELMKETTAKVKKIQEWLRSSNDNTTLYAKKRRRDLEFEIRD